MTFDAIWLVVPLAVAACATTTTPPAVAANLPPTGPSLP